MADPKPLPTTCGACSKAILDDEGPYAECGLLGYGLGGSIVRHAEPPPRQCPLQVLPASDA